MLTESGDLYGTLTIHNTSFRDSGEYKCSVANMHGTDSLSVNMTVQSENCISVSCFAHLITFLFQYPRQLLLLL